MYSIRFYKYVCRKRALFDSDSICVSIIRIPVSYGAVPVEVGRPMPRIDLLLPEHFLGLRIRARSSAFEFCLLRANLQSAGCFLGAGVPSLASAFRIRAKKFSNRATRERSRVCSPKIMYMYVRSCHPILVHAPSTPHPCRPHLIHVHIPPISTLHACAHSVNVNVRAPSMSTHHPCPHVFAPPEQTHLDSQSVFPFI